MLRGVARRSPNTETKYIPMIDSAHSIARLARQIAAGGFFSLSAILAASDSGAKVKEPTEVQGVVEVLNDVLRVPFRKTIGGSTTAPGTFPFPGGFIKHDIPAGKRLIVETISLQVRVTPGQNVLVQMQNVRGGSLIDATVQLPVQKQGTFGSMDYLTATHNVMLRLDGGQFDNEISFAVERDATTGSLELSATIFGYLVDIPPTAP